MDNIHQLHLQQTAAYIGDYLASQNKVDIYSMVHILDTNPIGRGTYGKVFKCFWAPSDKELCIKLPRSYTLELTKSKTLRPQQGNSYLAIQKSFKEEFELNEYIRECSVMYRLHKPGERLKHVSLADLDKALTEQKQFHRTPGHANIIPYRHLDLSVPCIIMHQCTATLAHIAQRKFKDDSWNTELSKDANIRSMMSQIHAGLSFMHSRDVAHRDIKPENILVEIKKDPLHVHCYISDFGLAKMAKYNTLERSKAPWQVYTFGYRAPELYTAAGSSYIAIWQTADLYAFALMGLYMFNYRIFNGQDPVLDPKSPKSVQDFIQIHQAKFDEQCAAMHGLVKNSQTETWMHTLYEIIQNTDEEERFSLFTKLKNELQEPQAAGQTTK